MFYTITTIWESFLTLIAFIWVFPSIWVIIRLFRLELFEKVKLHRLHWYSCSPVCTLICCIRSLFLKKALSQCLHWYGLSPVCVFIWLIRLLFLKKALSHSLHWYGFSPVCVLRCLFISILRVKVLSHWFWKPYHIGYIDMVSSQYVSSYAYLD